MRSMLKIFVRYPQLLPTVLLVVIFLEFGMAVPCLYFSSTNDIFLKWVDFVVLGHMFDIAECLLLICNVVIFIYFCWIQKSGIKSVVHFAMMFCAGILFLYVFININIWTGFNDYRYDRFADDLNIPTDIMIDEPLNTVHIDSLVSQNMTDFVLLNGFQGGLYSAVLLFSPKVDGKVYMEATEVTTGTILSNLKNLSIKGVEGVNTDSLTLVKWDFIQIHEGNWEQFYAARFDIWFEADQGAKSLIISKIYKIQGWMR